MKLYVDKLFNLRTKGTDIYKHNSSTWLIFTNEKKWVIELTSSGTLWYNYYFFKRCFDLLSLDVVENQHYITKWVEDTVINRVNPALTLSKDNTDYVEDVIQNGVKHLRHRKGDGDSRAENIIQNGVKETELHKGNRPLSIKDTIQNGVKNTVPMGKDTDSIVSNDFGMNDAIQNGVKETHKRLQQFPDNAKDAIQNGVIHTKGILRMNNSKVEDTIQNGVIHTKVSKKVRHFSVEDTIQNGVKHTEYGDWEDGDERLDDIIQNGIKETKTPGDGDLLATIKWMNENNTYSVPKMIDDIVDNGIKATTTNLCLSEDDTQYEEIDDVIKNGIKTTQSGILFDESKIDTVINEGVKEIHIKELSESQVNRIIKNGVKECKPSHTPLYNPMDFSVEYRENHRLDDVASVLEKGIKEAQPLPSQDGNKDWGLYYQRQEDRTKPHTEYVDGVIENGVKETNWRRVDNFPEFEERVINGGTKI